MRRYLFCMTSWVSLRSSNLSFYRVPIRMKAMDFPKKMTALHLSHHHLNGIYFTDTDNCQGRNQIPAKPPVKDSTRPLDIKLLHDVRAKSPNPTSPKKWRVDKGFG